MSAWDDAARAAEQLPGVGRRFIRVLRSRPGEFIASATVTAPGPEEVIEVAVAVGATDVLALEGLVARCREIAAGRR